MAELGEIPRAIIGHNHTGSKDCFVMETELKLGTRQGVVCGKMKEGEIISRMDQYDKFWDSW